MRAFGTSGVATEGWTLDVLTGGAPANHLLAVAQDLGIDDHVTLWPRLSRDDLQQRFLEAAVFCSVPSSDATSVAVLEGMAAGVYPIVSDLAANRALVTAARRSCGAAGRRLGPHGGHRQGGPRSRQPRRGRRIEPGLIVSTRPGRSCSARRWTKRASTAGTEPSTTSMMTATRASAMGRRGGAPPTGDRPSTTTAHRSADEVTEREPER